MKNKIAKKFRVWFIKNQDSSGYWSDCSKHFLEDLASMSPDDKFEITCKDLSEKEFGKLEESSPEFDGW